MIDVIIKTKQEEQLFSNELLSFQYNIRNNDAATFTVSVPKVTASIVIGETTAFLKSVVRGDVVKVTTSDTSVESPLTIELSVIENVVFDKKGETHISCTALFFEGEDDFIGPLKLPKMVWETFKHIYGLEKIFYYQNTTPEMLVDIKKKEDLILAMAWSAEEKFNVTVTPFTTYTGVRFNTPGIGLVPDAEPEEEDENVPVYKMRAEDIYSYVAEPAQPPVTHLATTSLSMLEPTPQIEGRIKAVQAHIGDESLYDFARIFVLEETQTTAMHIKSDTVTEPVIEQKLLWSDGIETPLPQQEFRHIIGIFSTSYAYITPPPNSQIHIADRETSEVKMTLTGLDNTVFYRLWKDEDDTIRRTHFISTDESDEILLFRSSYPTTHSGLHHNVIGLVKKGESYGKLVYEKDVSMPDLLYLGSNKVRQPDTEQIQLGMVHMATDYRIVVSAAQPQNVGNSIFKLTPKFTELGGGQTNLYTNINRPFDAIIRYGDTSETLIARIAWRTQGTPAYPLLIDEYTIPLQQQYAERAYRNLTADVTHFVWLLPPTFVAGNMPDKRDNSFIERYGFDDVQVLYLSGGDWSYKNWQVATFNLAGATPIEPLMSGTAVSWLPKKMPVKIMFTRNVFGMIFLDWASDYVVSVQHGAIPFLSRSKDAGNILHKIAEGQMNPAYLSNKLGALLPHHTHQPQEKGRMEIDFASFEVRGSSEAQYREVYAHQLDMPAIGSHLFVQLDPRDTTYVKTKVVGVTLSFEGGFAAKVSVALI